MAGLRELGGITDPQILADSQRKRKASPLLLGSLGPHLTLHGGRAFLLHRFRSPGKPLGIKRRFNFQCRPIPEVAGVKKDRAPVGSEHTSDYTVLY